MPKYRLRWRIQELIRWAWRQSIGFRLALWLDKKHPTWCWAHLCTTIGLGYDFFDWEKFKHNSCRKDCEELGSCWCGKMVRDVDDERPEPF